jgi:hypothetical protein
MKLSTSAGRRYNLRLIPMMLLYCGVLIACIWAIKHWHPTGLALVVLSVLPALPILGAIAVMGLYLIEETDEFLRQRVATCMLVGTAALLTAVTVYGFLANGGAIAPRSDIGLWGFPLWCAAWGLAQCVLGFRDYRAGGDA